MDLNTQTQNIIQKLDFPSNFGRILVIAATAAVLLGVGTGYYLSTNQGGGNNFGALSKPPESAQEDIRTFKDFAIGKIEKKPATKNGADYSEGTHLLIREGAVPVALTSSVVDLSIYEGKKVKVFGETNKALKAGWLMDVGKVEEEK